MSAWTDTVQQLLVGASRSTVDSQRLLADCAALGLARRGAQLPPASADTVIAAARPETRPVAGRRVGVAISTVITWEDDELLRECCRVLDAAGLVAPHRQLPDLLATATGRPGLRPPVNQVLGTRGHWLAGQRPAWAWAAGTAATETDQPPVDEVLDAPVAQRKAGLRGARLADPERVRAFISANWGTLRRAEDRRLLVAALAHGLEPADEPLLETALDDRSLGVHDEAMRLLRRLPGSAFSQRAEQRLREGLEPRDQGLDVRPGAGFDLHDPDDAETRDLPRDGGARLGVGNRLLAAASSVAPEFWTRQFGPAAAALLKASPWASVLLRGVAAALPLADDPAVWLPVLGDAVNHDDLLDVLNTLPAAVSAAALAGLAGTWSYDELDHACSQLPGPWPADTTSTMLDRFASLADRTWRTGRPPEVLLRRGDVSVLTAQWERIAERWPDHGNEQLVLHLRAELHQAVSEDLNRKEPE